MRLNNKTYDRWLKRIKTDNSFGDITLRINKNGTDFNTMILHSEKVAPTIATKGCEVKYDLPIKLSLHEYCCIGSYPNDYDFKSNQPNYIIGMSVPPIVIAQISNQIYLQWLSKINNN